MREGRKKGKGEKDLIYRIENPLTHWSPSQAHFLENTYMEKMTPMHLAWPKVSVTGPGRAKQKSTAVKSPHQESGSPILP